MGKKAKERKQTQVSPDYISALAGNSGILRDMAGHFAGTGRYVVPAITAAYAMQGTVMPVCQAQGQEIQPADSAYVGVGDYMVVSGTGDTPTVVNSVTANNGLIRVSGGVTNSTRLISGATMLVYSGGIASNTDISRDCSPIYVGKVE